MIFDGPRAFPDSCVAYTSFRHHEPRQLFAYLREYEFLLQREVNELGKGGLLERAKEMLEASETNDLLRALIKIVELDAVQRNLQWVAHNVTGSEEERAMRRRGFGSAEHIRGETRSHNWTPTSFTQLLAGFLEQPEEVTA